MLLEELLQEARSVRDFRHEDVSSEFKYWGTKEMGYIDPKDGFNFIYSEGQLILFSTNNETYSAIVGKGLWKKMIELQKSGKSEYGIPREISAQLKGPDEDDLWNQLGGTVSYADKTITFFKEDANGKMRQRVVNNIKDFKAALKNIQKYGVKSDFKIKGLPAPLNGMTVEKALAMTVPSEELLKQNNQVMYHGTSLKRWEEIKTKGLRPGHTGEAYSDLIPGYSEHNVYLATDAKTAEFYGKRQAKKDDDTGYVILKITVPDAGKFLPDDAFAHGLKKGEEFGRAKYSVKQNGSVAYKGIIRPKFIEVISTRKA